MRYNRKKEWLAAALAYAKCGWKVVPMHGTNTKGRCTCDNGRCPTPGRHAWMEFWEREATCSDSDLQRYSEFPIAHNLGIILGESGDLAALVAATPEAEAYVRHHEHRIEAFDPGPKFSCSDRGVVWLFERPEEFGALPDEVALDDGLTLILGTHLLLMPPHVRGAYTFNHLPQRWLSHPASPAQVVPRLPFWVLDDAGITNRETFDRVREIERAFDEAEEEDTSRHRALRHAGDGHAVGPAVAAQQAPEEALRHDVRPPEETAPPVNQTVVEQARGLPAHSGDGATGPAPRAEATPSNRSPLPPLPFRTGDAGDLPARPVAGPWVRSETTTLLLGDPKTSGTTTFLLYLAQAVFRRRPFLGHATRRSPVLYLTSQSRASYRVSQSQAIMRPCPDIDSLCTLHRDEVGHHSWRSLMREVTEHAAAIGARLLIIDGLDRFVTLGAATERVATESILDELGDATQTGLAVVAAMHRRPAGPAPSYYDDLLRSVDQQLTLVPARYGGPRSRELHSQTRFSDTPDVTHLDYDVHTRNYRVVRAPEVPEVSVAMVQPPLVGGDSGARIIALHPDLAGFLPSGDGRHGEPALPTLPLQATTRDGVRGRFSIRALSVPGGAEALNVA